MPDLNTREAELTGYPAQYDKLVDRILDDMAHRVRNGRRMG